MWSHMKKIKSVNFQVPEFVKKFPKIQLGKHIPPKLTQSQVYTKTRTAASRTLAYIKKHPKKLGLSHLDNQALKTALQQVKANPSAKAVWSVVEKFK